MPKDELIGRLEAATDALSDAADILLINGYPMVAESYRKLARDNRAALRQIADSGNSINAHLAAQVLGE